MTHIALLLSDQAPVPAAAVIELVREGRIEELPEALRRVEAPIDARFYLSRRLPETAEQFLREFPDHTRSRLERYLLVTYREGVDTDAVVEAMREDPFVEYAYSSSGGDDGSEPGPPPSDPGRTTLPPAPPWHLEVMNFYSAWEKQRG